MRCMSCGADVPPQWVNALINNICPGCGGEIMNSSTQELLKELSEAMQRMPNDPQGVAGWLLSNYRFQKVGDAQPVEKFHRKGGSGVVSGGVIENDVSENGSGGLKIAPSYHQFVNRNDAAKYVARSNELAAKFNSIRNPNMQQLASMIQNVDDNDIEDSSNMPTDEDIKAYNDMKKSGIDPFANLGSMNSAPLPGNINDLYQAIDPNDVAKIIKQNDESVPLDDEILMAQTPKGQAILQQNQFKKLRAQEAIHSSGGSFRRA